MFDKLNNLESTILNRIAADFPFLGTHIQFLKVKDREKTGVGMYINFVYEIEDNSIEPIQDKFHALSSNSHLNMKGLKNGFAYEIAITAGQIDFLEIVTIGEEKWDGTVQEFWFSEQ